MLISSCVPESRPTPPTPEKMQTCLESVLLQSDRQAWERLVSGASLCDDGEAGGWPIVVSGGDLDASDGGRFVRCLGRSDGRKSALRKLCSSLAAKSQLAAPRQSRSANHGLVGGAVGCQLTIVEVLRRCWRALSAMGSL
jgi:hypothetical protein